MSSLLHSFYWCCAESKQAALTISTLGWEKIFSTRGTSGDFRNKEKISLLAAYFELGCNLSIHALYKFQKFDSSPDIYVEEIEPVLNDDIIDSFLRGQNDLSPQDRYQVTLHSTQKPSKICMDIFSSFLHLLWRERMQCETFFSEVNLWYLSCLPPSLIAIFFIETSVLLSSFRCWHQCMLLLDCNKKQVKSMCNG